MEIEQWQRKIKRTMYKVSEGQCGGKIENVLYNLADFSFLSSQ